MGFMKFGMMGGAGGAEVTVWLNLRDNMSKRLNAAKKNLASFHTGNIVRNANAVNKMSQKDFELVRNKLNNAYRVAQGEIKSFDSAQTRLDTLNTYKMGAIKKVALAERAYSGLVQENLQLGAKMRETTSKKEQASIRGRMSATKKAIDETYKDVRAAKAHASQIGSVIGITQKQVDASKMQTQSQLGLRGVMGLNLMGWKKNREAGVKYSSVGGKVADKVRMMTHGMRGFRMELLSVMFFGMAIQRMMFGLLRPAMELTGIFDMISAVLEILFLPLAIVLLDLLMPLFEWFMNLDEGVKMFMGTVVLISGVLGFLAFTLGQIGLGIGGLIVTFGGLAAILPLIPLIGATILALLPALGALIESFMPGVQAAEQGTIKSKGVIERVVESLGGVFEWFGELIDDIFKTIREAIPEDFRFAFDAVAILLEAFTLLLSGDWESTWAKMQEAVGTALGGLVGIISSIIRGVIDWLKELPFIGDIIAIVEDVWRIIIGVLTGNWEDVQDAIDDIIHRITKWVEWGVYMGEQIGKALIDGIMKAIFNLPELPPWKVPTPGFVSPLWGGEFRIGGAAEGGIFTRPTISMIGERGPEAVVPLGAGARGFGSTNIISYEPHITVDARIDKDIDIDELASRISDILRTDLSGMIGG